MLTQIVNSFRAYYWQQVPSLDVRHLLQDRDRTLEFCIKAGGDTPVMLDFTKENIDQEGIKFFDAVWKDRNVEGKKQAMFAGQKINFTEGKPALHTALRAEHDSFVVDGVDVGKEIKEVRAKIASIAQDIREGKRVGVTGKKFKCILNIGIGGSLLGLKSAYCALCGAKELAGRDDILSMRFVANVDPTDFAMETRDLDWETTLVIISSKSFTTMETTLNMNLVKQQMVAALKKINSNISPESIFAKHFLASTANSQNALKSGIPVESCFKFWDWVGGRFSVVSFNSGIQRLRNPPFSHCSWIRCCGCFLEWNETDG